jgi:hypothetical protein
MRDKLFFYESNLQHLKDYAEAPYEVDIKISAANDCCDRCKKLAEKTYTLEEAFKLMPVPNRHCNHDRYSHCRCRYIAIPKRDAEGRLIMKQANS